MSNGVDDDSTAVRGAVRNNSDGPQIFSLELEDYNSEEEIYSLIHETVDDDVIANTQNGGSKGRLADLRKRNSKQSASDGGGMTSGAGSMLGYLRSTLRDAVFSSSHVRLLAILAVGSAMFVLLWTNRLSNEKLAEVAPKSPHSASLGGMKNPGHFDPGAIPHPLEHDDDDLEFTHFTHEVEDEERDPEGSGTDDDMKDTAVLLPTNNVGERVSTKNHENAANYYGHYRHDVLRSVYSSQFYLNNTDAVAEQQAFEAAMKNVVATYGQWDPPLRAEDEWTNPKTPLKDYEGGYLTEIGAWQSDAEYVKGLLNQSKLLVSRVKEGIYATYGFGLNDATQNVDAVKTLRSTQFQAIVGDVILTEQGAAIDASTKKPLPGIAYLNTAGWKGLVRKLLHSMMTMDNWYVVVVGNANTYAGNNFQQSAVMEFNDIMEPVFNRLGMKLIARNMGMNASTSITALGGADITGEADILWHIPDNRENFPSESLAMVDLLHKQAILSGERLPVILSPVMPQEILTATNQTAWFGNIQPGASFCDMTQSINGAVKVPVVKACRFVRCDASVNCNRHSSTCWIPRQDYTPTQKQDANVGNQNDGYPNFRQQKLEGAKLAMLILHALQEALKQWEEQTNLGAVPLPDDMWHVGTVYSSIRERVRTMGWGSCDHFMRKTHPSICHMQMHAYTEWTPQAHSNRRLKSIVKTPLIDTSEGVVEAYDRIDLWPKEWKIDTNASEVDVHMIAIAAVADHLASDQGGKQGGDGGSSGDVEEYDNGFESPDDDGDSSGRAYVRLRDRRRSLASNGSNTWTVYNAPIGFCDGSSNSHCNRVATNTCFLSKYNHYRAGLMAHGQSGKLSLSIPKVKEGVVLARFDWELENGPRVRAFPHDFNFTMTVNGNATTMDRTEFLKRLIDLSKDLRVLPLLLDEKLNDRSTPSTQGRAINIDLEVRSKTTGTTPLLLLSHIYFA